jgi:hypothetical protein
MNIYNFQNSPDIGFIPFETKTKKSKKNINPKRFFLLLALSISTIYIGSKVLEISEKRIEKRNKEIAGILSKSVKEKYNFDNSCEVYSLRARINGIYPCYNCGINPTIYLYASEIWKSGKTCIGEDNRYSNLEELNLQFFVLFTGTEKECLVREKELIYAYPTLPECLKRDFIMLRPAGNRIDR